MQVSDADPVFTSPLAGKIFLGLAAFHALALLDLVFGVLRFSSAFLNWSVMTLAFAVPALLLPGLLALRETALRIGLGVLIGLWSLPCLVACLWSGMMSADSAVKGFDPSFVRLGSVQVDGGCVAVYESHAGAFDSVRTVVRQERTLVPGILLTRRLATFEPSAKASLETLDDGSVRVEAETFDYTRPQIVTSHEVILRPKRWVYF